MIEGLFCILLVIALSVFNYRKLMLTQQRLIEDLKNLIDSPLDQSSSVSKYLAKIRMPIQLENLTFAYTEDPINFLSNRVLISFKSDKSYKFGSTITGISLMLTFILIGVAVFRIGNTLPGLSSGVAVGAMNDLGGAISGMAFKFAVSVMGLLCSILYQFGAKSLEDELYNFINYECLPLRTRAKLHSVISLETEFSTLRALLSISELAQAQHKETLETVKNITDINVCISELSDNLSQDLGRMLNKEVGDKITELLNAQKNSTEVMAEKLSQALSESITPELNRVFSELGEKLPSIVMGGASETTQRVSQTFESIASSLPALIGKLENVSSGLGNSVESNLQSASKVNEEMMLTMNNLISKFTSVSHEATANQGEILGKLSDAAEKIMSKSIEGVTNTSNFLQSSSSTVRAHIESTNQSLSEGLENLKLSLKEVNNYAQLIRNENERQMKEFSVVINESSKLIQSTTTQNELVNRSIQSLGQISSNLGDLPRKTSEALQSLNTQANELKTNTLTMKAEYVKGIEEIHRLYSENLNSIKVQTSALNEAYAGAASSLQTSLEPLSDFSDSVEKILQINFGKK